MAWIESHQEIGQHPKTKRLARMLGASVPAVIGHLHLLWHWALDFAQDGDLSKFDPEDIADAAMWDGDPERFMSALIDCGPGDSCGFAESDDDGTYLHDWDQYAGRLIEQRAANAERARKSRETRKKRARNVRATCGATVPDLTEPDPKDQNHMCVPPEAEPHDPDTSDEDKSDEPPPQTKRNDYPEDFERFWQAYPSNRRVGKKGAHKAWQAQLRRKPPRASPDELIAAAERYAAECERKGTAASYTMHPKTFLGPSDPYEDYLGNTGTVQAATALDVDPDEYMSQQQSEWAARFGDDESAQGGGRIA